MPTTLFKRLILSFVSHLWLAALAAQSTEVATDWSPLVLAGDTTHVFLSDYFIDPSKIERIETHAQLVPHLATDKRSLRLIKGKNLPFLSNLDFILRGGKRFSIVVKVQQQQTVVFQLPDEGYTKVVLKGDFNGDRAQDLTLKEGLWQTALPLSAGRYAYQFIADGIAMSDPSRPPTLPNSPLSEVVVADPMPKPQLHTASFDDPYIWIGYDHRPQRVLAYWGNQWIPTSTHNYTEGGNFDDKPFRITLPYNARAIKRSFIRVYAYNAQGMANDLCIPLEYGAVVAQTHLLDRYDRESHIVYMAVIDRFYNGQKKNDRPIADNRLSVAANWQGGDLVGLTEKIKEGYFKKLNINNLCLSPIFKNPETAFQSPNTYPQWQSGYHGYWPISLSQIDPHFGTSSDLHALIRTAHQQNTHVLIDPVGNRLHTEHPLFRQYPDWQTAPSLDGGQANLRLWESQPQSTWFEPFLGTLDLNQAVVRKALIDSTLFWSETFDIDGFRHSSAPFMPAEYWRQWGHSLRKTHLLTGKPLFQMGDSPATRAEVAFTALSRQADSQIDRWLYRDIRALFETENSSFLALVESLRSSLQHFGHHHLMGNPVGQWPSGHPSLPNDKTTPPLSKRPDKTLYAQGQLQAALIMALPGLPIIAAGDEIGSKNPHNLLKFDKLNSFEAQTLSKTQALSQLRRDRMSLQYGSTEILWADAHTLVLLRDYFGDITVAVFNKKNSPQTLQFDLPARHSERLLKNHFGQKIQQKQAHIELTLPPYGFDYLIGL